MKIIAIGGGEIRKKETLVIDQYIVESAKKDVVNVLFVPTASGDDEVYCELFDKTYGTLLGCKTDSLCVIRRPKDRSLVMEKINWADIIYVGGGNTLRMLKLWRQLGIDQLLHKAAKNGKILSGLSAGAICWHEYGHSDSRFFSGNPDWSYIRVRGLGLVKGMFCPHFDVEKRHQPLSEMIIKHGGMAIACDNCAAIVYDTDIIKCVTSKTTARLYSYRKVSRKVEIKEYRNGDIIPL